MGFSVTSPATMFISGAHLGTSVAMETSPTSAADV